MSSRKKQSNGYGKAALMILAAGLIFYSTPSKQPEPEQTGIEAEIETGSPENENPLERRLEDKDQNGKKEKIPSIDVTLPAEEPKKAANAIRHNVLPETRAGKSKLTYETDKPVIAVVIDDLGGSGSDVKNLERLESIADRLTFAIIPGEQNTKDVLNYLKNHPSYTLIMHQEMQTNSKTKKGRANCLYVTDDKNEIAEKLRDDLDSLKSYVHIIGMNNHMGGLATCNKKTMAYVADFINDHNANNGDDPLFFLDSNVTPKSVAFRTMKKSGVVAYMNHNFIDSEEGFDNRLKALKVSERMAIRDGQTVIIGHIAKDDTIKALLQYSKEAKAEMVPITHLKY